MQPYADSLASMLLMALPWADETLVRGSGAAMTQLLDLVGQYMEARPVKSSPALAPFLEASGEEDLAAQSDSGAASFLPQVWCLKPLSPREFRLGRHQFRRQTCGLVELTGQGIRARAVKGGPAMAPVLEPAG